MVFGILRRFFKINGASGYRGSILSPNGFIYLAPYSAPRVAKLNTSTNIISQIGDSMPSIKYSHLILAQNGSIYSFPIDVQDILKITNDVTTYIPKSDSFTRFASILAPNGYLYAIPGNATNILKLNPSNDSLSSFGSLSNDVNKYRTGSLAFNNNVYCPPYNETRILKIDTSNDTISYFGNINFNSNQYSGIQLAPNGNLYCIPVVASTPVMKINPNNDTISYLTTPSTFTGSDDVSLGLDGNIYSLSKNGRLLIIDTSTDVCRVIMLKNMDYSAIGFVGASTYQGKIYLTPNSVNYIGLINRFNSFNVLGSDALIPSNLSDLPTSNYNKYYNKL